MPPGTRPRLATLRPDAVRNVNARERATTTTTSPGASGARDVALSGRRVVPHARVAREPRARARAPARLPRGRRVATPRRAVARGGQDAVDAVGVRRQRAARGRDRAPVPARGRDGRDDRGVRHRAAVARGSAHRRRDARPDPARAARRRRRRGEIAGARIRGVVGGLVSGGHRDVLHRVVRSDRRGVGRERVRTRRRLRVRGQGVLHRDGEGRTRRRNWRRRR